MRGVNNAMHVPEGNTPPLALSRYVDAERLRITVWEPESAPSLRSIRTWQANGTLPYVKLGARVWFDPAAVKAALESRRTRKARA